MADAEGNAQPKGIGLNRTLGLWNLIIIGMVIIQPTAPMGIYGVISNKAHGHVVTAILIAMVGMLFTAICYGRMARIYPSAGSAYTYVGQEMHSALGYVVGWGMVMDYLINPLICTAICAKLTMNILPGLSFYFWILFYAALFTWGNLRGIKTSARMNEVLCAGMTVVVVLFLGSVVRAVWGVHHDPGFFTHPFYDPATFHPSSIFAGTSVAVLSYIGFDVFLSKQSDGTSLGFIVGDDSWNDPTIVTSFEKIARDAAPAVGGLPLKLRLENTTLEVKKDETLN